MKSKDIDYNLVSESPRLVIDFLSKYYNVKVDFVDDCDYGSCYYWEKRIEISINQTPKQMISTFFHELGHIYCYENSLWVSAHSTILPESYKTYIRCFLKAERWIDDWAYNECKKWFHRHRYIKTYYNKEGIEFTKDHLKEVKNRFKK
jgi:hypothetical protein